MKKHKFIKNLTSGAQLQDERPWKIEGLYYSETFDGTFGTSGEMLCVLSKGIHRTIQIHINEI